MKKLNDNHKQNISKGLLNYYKDKKTGTKNSAGYREIRVNNKTVYEHRYVWEQYNGKMPKGFHIHHINGIKDDNRIENLELICGKEHSKIHAINRHFGKNRKGVSPINKTNKEKINKIINLRTKGLKLDEIVEITGLSYPTVQKYSKL